MYCNCAVPRNLAVECQKLYDSNEHWKKKYGYHQRFLRDSDVPNEENAWWGIKLKKLQCSGW